MSINVKIAIIYTPIGLDNKKNLWLVLNNKKMFGCCSCIERFESIIIPKISDYQLSKQFKFSPLGLACGASIM